MVCPRQILLRCFIDTGGEPFSQTTAVNKNHGRPMVTDQGHKARINGRPDGCRNRRRGGVADDIELIGGLIDLIAQGHTNRQFKRALF